MADKFKVLSSTVVYFGKWIEVRKDTIIKPDGTVVVHEIAKRKDCILVLGFKNKSLLLTKQYRYPANELLWELPTGFIDKDETPLMAAKREFEEESGLNPFKIELLGSFWTWPGFSTQKTYVFFANKFTIGKKSLDVSESDLKCKFIPYLKVIKMVEKGIIKSSTTLGALTILSQTKKDLLLDLL